jgi:excisionase family DNA binding protein
MVAGELLPSQEGVFRVPTSPANSDSPRRTSGWGSVQDAADMFGIHPATVRRLIAAGEIEARRLRRRLVVNLDTVGKPVRGGAHG